MTIGAQLPDALQALTRARSTGILTVTNGDDVARFAVHNGELVWASSDAGPALGTRMVNKGLVTAASLERVLAHQRRKKQSQPLGTILYELDLVEHEVAATEIEEQIFRVFSTALEWTSGDYGFESVEHDYNGVVMSGCTLETQLKRVAACRVS